MYTNLVYFLILINLVVGTQPFQFKNILIKRTFYIIKYEKSIANSIDGCCI